ncbi:DNA primase [Fructilactobacillus frigidiflavus]|uniref:DNA primase n=1 Tax=Fructilactobacillus frigidiflavus TaxID=3242688 RepID=UPI003757C85F
MAKIPEEFVEKVRNNTNIRDIVGQYVQLKKAGKNLFGLCPFHEERTPSFSVNEEKQIFHCFSCGRGGNVFSFLMDLKGLSFPEAVEMVAKDDGIELPSNANWNQPSPQQQKLKPLIEINEAAAKLYHHVLINTKLGEEALNYLKKRQISDEMIETFNLGYAPNERILKKYFEEKKADYQALRKTGLFTETSDGELRDRFAGRLMVPIRNEHGKTVGFSGRLLHKDEDMPKYLNSPETELFNKRKIMYNFDLAKPEIRQTHDVILFEGFMDVISAYQAGVKNGVASMGTSLTEEQIYDLQRVTKQIYVCYDGDTPGQKATNRAIDLLKKNGNLNIGIIQMPDGIDPDEYRRSHGEVSFQQVVKNGRESIVKFKINYLRTQFNLTNEEDRLAYIDKVLHIIAGVENNVERDVYLKELADRLDLSLASLETQTEKYANVIQKRSQSNRNLKRFIQTPTVLNQEFKHYSRIENAERHLLNMMLHNSEVWKKVRRNNDFAFVHDLYQQIFIFAQEYFRYHAEYNAAEFSDFVGETNLQATLAELEMTNDDTQYNEEEIADCVKIIMQDAPIMEELEQKKADFNNAKQLGDEILQLKLATELIDLQKRLQNLKSAED